MLADVSSFYTSGYKSLQSELLACHRSSSFAARLYPGTRLVLAGRGKLETPSKCHCHTSRLSAHCYPGQTFRAGFPVNILANNQQPRLLNHRTINWPFMHHCQISPSLIWIRHVHSCGSPLRALLTLLTMICCILRPFTMLIYVWGVNT